MLDYYSKSYDISCPFVSMFLSYSMDLGMLESSFRFQTLHDEMIYVLIVCIIEVNNTVIFIHSHKDLYKKNTRLNYY